MKVSVAVEREEAEKLTRAKKARGKIDRRNLYLANEGLIVEDDGLEVRHCIGRTVLSIHIARSNGSVFFGFGRYQRQIWRSASGPKPRKKRS